MIGRQTEYNTLLENIAKAQHTLLTGNIGIGKTHLLKEAQPQLDKAIYVESISPLKSSLLNILQTIHKSDDLVIEGIEAEYLTWEEVVKKLNRLNSPTRAHYVVGFRCAQDA